MCPPLPANEEERLAALRHYALLDTPPEAAFDRLASLAARLFGVPLSLVTLVDRDRQWFKSCQGPAGDSLGLRETGRDLSFCAHTILSDEPMVVEDARRDPRFADNPLVTGELNVRFYAGAPLRDAEGHALGALCLVDFQPRAFPAESRAALADLAAAVVSEMELRRASADLARSEHLYRQMFSGSPHPMWVFDIETLRFLAVNETAVAHYGYSRAEFLGMTLADIRPAEDCEGLNACRPCQTSLWRHRKKDGTLIWVETAAHTVDYGDRPARLVIASDVTERKQAEEALRRSEQTLSLHLRQTPLAFIEWNRDAEVVAWNPAAERIFGYSRSEALGRRMIPVLVPERAQAHVEAVADALRSQSGGERSANENRTKDGRAILCEWYNTPLIDDAGRMIGAASLAQDVTEQRRAEAALRESEGKYRLLAEGMEDVVGLHDAQGNLLYVSPSVFKLTGYTPEEALAAETLSEIHPDDRAKLRAGGGPQGGHSALFEVRRRRKGGGYVWVEVQGSPLPGGPGGPAGFVSVMRDITGRREAEESARSLFENSVEGIYRTTPEGRVLTVNAAAAHMLGHDTAEEARTFYTDLARQLYVDPARRAEFAALMREQGRVSDFEAEFRRKDGGVITVRLNARAVFGADGAVRCYEGFLADISARKALEREREVLEAEREALLAQTEALLDDALDRADHDPLTGLLNHRAFHKRLEEETEAAQRSGRPLALLLLDLDDFRFFNDAYGHSAGDDVLRQVAQSLWSRCRAGDILARFGGDEFALLMPGAAGAQAAEAAGHLREAVARLGFRPPGYDATIPLGLSVGVACAPYDGAGRVALLEAADARLRVARSGGEAGEAVRLRRAMSRAVEGFTMLDALVTAVDNKDRYTRKHSEDVLTYSARIAAALGLDEKTRHTVEVAALLHDVGKIGVPDAVLRKPGRLTDDEFAAVRQHPLMGAIIVGAVPGFEDALDAVRHHHERWDGQGYPFGLRGEETPLLARLMAVADAYSAMTTDRPYRQGMDPAHARRLLQEGAGTQWDPACVAAFLRPDP